MTQLDPRLLTSSVVGLCADIDREPADHFLKELLADALGDAGASERMCEGLRWLAREGREPTEWNGVNIEWAPCWFYVPNKHQEAQQSFRIISHWLPNSFELAINDAGRSISGDTPSAACLAVALAWERADEGLVAEWMGSGKIDMPEFPMTTQPPQPLEGFAFEMELMRRRVAESLGIPPRLIGETQTRPPSPDHLSAAKLDSARPAG